MNRRSLLGALLVVFTPALTGCGAPWRVLRETVPDPFVNQRRFALLPIDYAGLRVGEKAEGEYLAGKDGDTAESFVGDKQGINDEFARALISRAHAEGIEIVLARSPADGPFVIRPHVSFMEPGFYAYITARPSKIEMTVAITALDGRVLDEIALTHGTPASLTNPSSGGRWRSDGKGLGSIVAEYLVSRVSP